MLVAAQIESMADGDRRRGHRHRSNAMARIRQLKRTPEMIHVTDISAAGCGFRARYAMPVGTRVLLTLPGLEVWLATVAWYEDGRGGLKFDRPLHSAVAARFAVLPQTPRS
jgi:hypothetical protein